MKCEFRLFNGEHQESEGVSSNYALTVNTDEDSDYKTIILPCDTDERVTSTGAILPLFKYFDAQKANIRSLAHNDGRFALDFSKVKMDGIYGEYNIALYQVTYDYCTDNEGNKDQGTPIDRVCETDFAVTKPYLAQKSSFGLTPKATTVNLDGYEDIKGNAIIKKTDLDKIMVLDADTYK